MFTVSQVHQWSRSINNFIILQHLSLYTFGCLYSSVSTVLECVCILCVYWIKSNHFIYHHNNKSRKVMLHNNAVVWYSIYKIQYLLYNCRWKQSASVNQKQSIEYTVIVKCTVNVGNTHSVQYDGHDFSETL